MPDSANGLWHAALIWISAIGAYFAGDSGRVLIASGLGGMTRWLASERIRVRDGLVAIITGAVAGRYLWPLALSMLGLEETPNNVAMAAFITGTLGISLVKIIAAVAESRAAKIGGGNG
ncbi:hypothetical protein EYE35_01080 [Cereibacter sphaeroides]|nr:hypothetical protein EYE35_01080 [Cereibacter sphaeroides]